MRSVNKVILIGNLTRDPDLRETPNGQSVCTFGIATNREWMARDTNKHSLAEYHELVAWARLAEICGKFLRKGKLVYIEGYLKTRSWDTPEGIRRHKTEIVVQDMIMLERRPKGEEGDDYIPAEDFDFVDDSAPAAASASMPTPTPATAPAVSTQKAPEHAPVAPKKDAPAPPMANDNQKSAGYTASDDGIEF